VTVLPGEQGTTAQEDQHSLRADLDEFVKNDDLDIDAFSVNGKAIVDTCYIDPGAVPLDSLANLPIQDSADL
jgi:hypothetical protein